MNSLFAKSGLRTKPQYLHFIMAGFVVLIVVLNQVANHHISTIYSSYNELNTVWAERLARISRLTELAARVNAPGNELLATGEQKKEWQNLSQNIVLFTEAYNSTVAELEDNLDRSTSAPILQELVKAKKSMSQQSSAAKSTFRAFEQGKIASAASHMARMDRNHSQVTIALGRTASLMRKIQKSHLKQQHESAEEIRTLDDIMSVIMVLLIAMSLLYGLLLNRRFKDYEEQQRHALQSLEKSEAFNRSILENTLEGIITITETGTILTANPAVATLFNYELEEMIGQNVKMLMPEEHASNHDTYLNNYRTTGINKIIGIGRELRARKKNGDEFPIDLAITEIKNEGQHIFIGAIRDISLQKEHEQKLLDALVVADEAARTKSAFLATMSHEIRTPMNGVLGMADVLSNTKLDSEQKNYLRVLQQSGKSLLHIIDDILDFSKIEAGKLHLENIEFNLEETVFDVGHLMSTMAEEKGIGLVLEYSASCPRHFYSDPGRIRQILINLIGNAIKFTEKGAVHVQIVCLPQQDDVHNIRFSVIDTGIGISREAQAKLFTAFTQADSSTTRKFGGSGLGLSISKQLVEAMHGHIEVLSQPGLGSEFIFTLPLKAAEHQHSNDSSITQNIQDLNPAKAESANKRLQGHILLTEDNSVNQMVAQAMLETFGLTLDIANNGQEALALLQKNHYALVLMDIQMPVMDGITATRAIRGLETEQRHMPIIALTANAQAEDQQKYQAAGMDDFLAKPFNKDEFFTTLQRWLRNQSNVEFDSASSLSG